MDKIEDFILKCCKNPNTPNRQHVTEDVLGAFVVGDPQKKWPYLMDVSSTKIKG